MPPIVIQLIIGLATPLVTLIGVLVANSKSQTLMQYQIKELSDRVDKHNNLIDRMYHVEERLTVIETKIDDLDN